MRGLNIMKCFSTLNLTGTLITCPTKAISKMKLGKAAGPSVIVVEMIKAAGDTGATMICDLATGITVSVMARGQSSIAFTRARVMLWTEATVKASS